MTTTNETTVILAEPDSHYRLIPCGCGCTAAHYERRVTAFGNLQFRAVCPECGEHTLWDWTQHGAQEDWNGDAA